jgi:hypothetical protein
MLMPILRRPSSFLLFPGEAPCTRDAASGCKKIASFAGVSASDRASSAPAALRRENLSRSRKQATLGAKA